MGERSGVEDIKTISLETIWRRHRCRWIMDTLNIKCIHAFVLLRKLFSDKMKVNIKLQNITLHLIFFTWEKLFHLKKKKLCIDICFVENVNNTLPIQIPLCMRSCLRNSIPNFLRRSYIACCHCCGNGMEIGKKRIWKGSGTDIKYHKRPNWSTECSILPKVYNTSN